MTILEDLILSASDRSHTRSHWMRRRATMGLNIEKAALELFLEHGPENVSIDDIAARADISRRSIFRYFRTKEEILAAMPARQMVASTRAVCERPAHESIIQAILSTTQSIDFSKEEIEIITLSQKVMVKNPEYWSRAAGELRLAMDTCYELMIAHRLQLQGKDESNAGVIAAGLTAIVVHVYSEWVEQNCRGDFASKLEQSLKAFSEIGLPT